MLNVIEQDDDWYCVIWYEGEIMKDSGKIYSKAACKEFLKTKHDEGIDAEAYYNTELSWKMNW